MSNPRKKQPGKRASPPDPRRKGLLDAVKGCFTPDVLHRASSMMGESQTSMRQALEESATVVVDGLSQMASSREGALNLDALVRESNFAGLASNPATLFSGESGHRATNSGRQLVAEIFGSGASSVAELVASAGPVKTSSAARILAMVAPLALAMLKKKAAAEDVDPSQVEDLLGRDGQRASAAAPRWGPVAVPKRGQDADLVDQPSVEDFPESEGVTDQPAERPYTLRRILFLLAALIMLGLLILLLVRGPKRRTTLLPRTPLSIAQALSIDCNRHYVRCQGPILSPQGDSKHSQKMDAVN